MGGGTPDCCDFSVGLVQLIRRRVGSELAAYFTAGRTGEQGEERS